MTDIQNLAERHIREHESRLKHIDELLGRAHERIAEKPEAGPEFEELANQRESLASELEALRGRDVEDWETEGIAEAGPMGVWDVVAQALERFVERLER